MSEFTRKELNEILAKHQKWLYGEEGGKRADLRNADLSGMDLKYVEFKYVSLKYADLRDTDLTKADLRYADLSDAILSGAKLYRANLYNANLKGADLAHANLSEVNLCDADLRFASLYGVNFNRAYLKGANLCGAKLSKIKNLDSVAYNCTTSMFALNCPEEGSFIGFKKADRVFENGLWGDVIVKLQITEDAKRSSATTRKCRCSKAVVLGFYDLNHNELPNDINVESKHTSSFKYVVGETIEPLEPYEENRWIECASGIHFFMTFDEAVRYM